MACGCGRKGRVLGSRGVGTGQYRSTPNRTISPSQRRTLEMQENKKTRQEPQGMSLARREVIRKHRLAVQRALGH